MNGTRESTLLSRFKDGDAHAFAELVALHSGFIYGYVRARTADANEARTLTQNIFQHFYATRTGIEDAALLRPHLAGLARQAIAARVRGGKLGAWSGLCLDLEAMAPDDFNDIPPDRLKTCFHELGASAREALELRYRGSHGLSEIAARLRRSESAVSLLIVRAKQALRHCLEREADSAAAK